MNEAPDGVPRMQAASVEHACAVALAQLKGIVHCKEAPM